MRQKSVAGAATPEQIVEDIRRPTRKHHSAEENIRVVLEGLRGEARIVSWRRFYNTLRPHGSLDYRPPAPEVFIPQSARAAALPQPASPPALASRPPMH